MIKIKRIKPIFLFWGIGILFMILSTSVYSQIIVNQTPLERIRPEFREKIKAERAILIKNYQAEFDSLVNTADVIIEGNVIDGRGYPLDSTVKHFDFDTKMISCQLFRIKKIYRGHEYINYGTVQLVVKTIYAHGGYSINNNMTIFCKITDTSGLKLCFDNKVLDNNIVLTPYYPFVPTSFEETEKPVKYWMAFKDANELGKYLKKYPNIDIQIVPKEKASYKLKSAIFGEPAPPTDTAYKRKYDEMRKQYFERTKYYENIRLKQDSIKKNSRRSSSLK